MKEQYYPPPPTFVGGAGPYYPRKLPVSAIAVPEDAPPPGRSRQLAALALVVSLWTPAPPMPQQARRCVVQEAAADQVAPTRVNLITILRSWDPAPPAPVQQRRIEAQLIAVPEDPPPIRNRAWLDETLNQWQPPWPTYPPIRKLVQGVEDFGLPRPSPVNLQTILRSWQPADPPPVQLRRIEAQLIAVPENAPPPRSTAWRDVVLRAWQLEAPLRVRFAKLAQETAAVADNPPFGLSRIWLPPIVRAWQPGPPRPQAVKLLPPSVLAVTVNEPPYGAALRHRWLSTVLRAWQPPPPAPRVKHPILSPFVPTSFLLPDDQRKLLSMSRVRGRALIVEYANRAASGVGPLFVPSGQIRFPATLNLSSDPNTFDAYVEGDWNPVDASGAGLVLTVTSATYIRKAGECSVWLDVTFPVTANGAAVRLGGLPFLAHVLQNSALSIVVFAPLALSCFADSNTSELVLFNNTTSAFAINSQLSGVQFLIGGVIQLGV